MLGKLLKHEFKATGRVMLPFFGALLVLSVMVWLSINVFFFNWLWYFVKQYRGNKCTASHMGIDGLFIFKVFIC